MPYKRTGRPVGRPRKSIPPDDGQKPRLPGCQWRALQQEVRPFLEGVPVLPRFVQRTQQVADAAGVTQRTAQRWRKDKLYQRGFHWNLTEVVSYLQHLNISKGQNWRLLADLQQILEVHAWLADHWRGPLRSPLDGQIYSTSEAYAGHLIEAGAFHPEWRGL